MGIASNSRSGTGATRGEAAAVRADISTCRSGACAPERAPKKEENIKRKQPAERPFMTAHSCSAAGTETSPASEPIAGAEMRILTQRTGVRGGKGGRWTQAAQAVLVPVAPRDDTAANLPERWVESYENNCV